MHTISWVIKVSKLCNLRCRYCYEWDDLAKTDRLSLDQWERIFHAIRRYDEVKREQFGIEVRSFVIWHGGEPLLLPTEYFRAVLNLQREIFGRDAIAEGRYANLIQTNLYSVSERHLEILRAGKFTVGVSMDFVPGVRLTIGNRRTEERVVANMERLRGHGIAFGAIVVLAGHTKRHLRTIYDFYDEIGVAGLRFIPLFDAPLNRPGVNFGLSYAEMVVALSDLFLYWIEEKHCNIRIRPLWDYFQNVLLHRLALSRTPIDRFAFGDFILLVNTDGRLFQLVERYDSNMALGNLFTQSIGEILDSPSYFSSLERDFDRFQRHCSRCKFLGGCDTYPVFAHPSSGFELGPCPIAYPVYEFMERYLDSQGFTREDLIGLLGEPSHEPSSYDNDILI